MNNLVFKHQEGLEFLESIPDNSVDLILTDPPYITSRDSGMNKWVGHIERQNEDDAENVKTEEDWEKYKSPSDWHDFFRKGKVHTKHWAKRVTKYKKDFLKYGSIYGKKYAVTTDYGEWDSEFTLEKLDLFVKHFHRILRNGGTCIIFFDLWKLTNLKDIMERAGPIRHLNVPKKPKKGESEEEFLARKRQIEENPEKFTGFLQLRFIEWIKTNPQPINSKVNYLTNCREIALLGIKKSKPTFNSKYDKGIYEYPLQGGKERFHPTQKSLPLFEDLIKKHSSKGDVVLDPFSGSATTAVAAIRTGREFIGCEINEEFFAKSKERINKHLQELENK